MLQGSNPNWSLGKGPNRRNGATISCTYSSPRSQIINSHCCFSVVVFFSYLSALNSFKMQGALASLSYTFHWRSSSFSSLCHMLVNKTDEHVYPNVVETFFSFNSLAVAHCSLSPVCFPSISHKSDLSKTLNTELPMFHPEWFQRLLKLVVFMARAEKGTSRGHVVLASCKVVRHIHTHAL